MPAGYESGQQFMLASIADSCHSSGEKCYPAVVLICNFLIKGEGEHLFIYLRTTCISFSVDYLYHLPIFLLS